MSFSLHAWHANNEIKEKGIGNVILEAIRIGQECGAKNAQVIRPGSLR